jgi:hypothetical protein
VCSKPRSLLLFYDHTSCIEKLAFTFPIRQLGIQKLIGLPTNKKTVIHGVTMKVNVDSKARKELVEAAWRRTEANCLVLFIFKESIPVKVELVVKTE